MVRKLMVERLIRLPPSDLGFEEIEQRIATVEVENPDEYTAEMLVDLAYREANMKRRSDEHRITALGKSMEVGDDA